MSKIAKWKPLHLLAVLAFCSSSLAQTKTNASLAKLSHVFSQMGKQLDENQLLCFAAHCCLQEDPKKRLMHYEGLFQDLVKLTSTQMKVGGKRILNAGNEELSYRSAVLLFDKESTLLLKSQYPSAIKRFVELKPKKGGMTFKEWKAFFSNSVHPNGDPEIALLAITLNSGWIRRALESAADSEESFTRMVHLTRLVKENDPYYHEDLYSMNALTGTAFGIDLSGPTRMNSNGWGKAYKTISGMNLAHVLWRKGYSREDILWSIRLATLSYETSDLLNDHLNRASLDQYVIQDEVVDESRKVSNQYQTFLERVRKELIKNTELKKELIDALTGVSALSSLNQKREFLSTDDDFTLSLLLLSYLQKNEKLFSEKFDPHLVGLSEKELLKTLLLSGAADTSTLTEGAKFTLDQLKDTFQKNKKHEGFIGDQVNVFTPVIDFACGLDDFFNIGKKENDCKQK